MPVKLSVLDSSLATLVEAHSAKMGYTLNRLLVYQRATHSYTHLGTI